MNLDADIKQTEHQMFLQEAEEHLQILDEEVARLEAQGNSADLWQETFRAAHTLKGNCAMIGQHRMAEIAGTIEGIANGLQQGTLTVNAEIIDTLRNNLDDLKTLKEKSLL